MGKTFGNGSWTLVIKKKREIFFPLKEGLEEAIDAGAKTYCFA